jgi:hypothetical protein
MNKLPDKFVIFTCLILLSGLLAGCTPDPVTSTINNTITHTTTIINTTIDTNTITTATVTETETITLTLVDRQPIEIASVEGPLGPINPGGPGVGITLKNISNENIVSLNATLELERAFSFEFDVSDENPLLPGSTIYSERILIGGGFAEDTLYPLQISGLFQDGTVFTYTEQVMIEEP